ncbi:hypothetical protein TcCL_ESM10619 [Trypanosoma cruzi]|nr:hypothetical protein TcCL_ESM10619 [Trypanosoma cruzi]
MSSARTVSNKVVSIPSQTDRRAAEAVPNSRSPNSQRRGITTVDEAECPVFRRGSAARGVCDGTVAEEPGPSRVPALVLPACPVCQYAWRLRWQPARKTSVKKTVEPLRHAKLRPSPTIGMPGQARRHVQSYCGWTSTLRCRLGRKTSIRRSLVGKELRRSRLEEFPRKQWRADLLSKERTAPPTQGSL